MLSFVSCKEAAKKWNLSAERVAVMCAENLIDGAIAVGNAWFIPSSAEKPVFAEAYRGETEKKTELRPFVKWVGGKSKLLPELLKYIAADGKEYSSYIEPMVGGGALLFCVLSEFDFKNIYICDQNEELMNAYRVLKSDADGLIARLEEMQTLYLPMDEGGRKYFYYSARDKFNNTPLSGKTACEKAALFIFLNKTCFNGLYRVNRLGQFNVPMGKYKNPMICDGKNLKSVSAALKNVVIECGDYSLSEKAIGAGSFVYVDPPYRPISKTSGFTSYTADAFDDKEQIRLAAFIKEMSARGARVVLSNSDPQNADLNDKFFEELYAGFDIKKVEAARMINSKSDKRGKIKELIICNR